MSPEGKYGIGFIEGVTPNKDRNAIPLDDEDVFQAAIIDIKNGIYRDAVFDGVFELVSTENPFYVSPEGMRVRVKCYWHCRRPTTQWPGFLLANATYSIDTNYTGKVFRNLGRPSETKNEKE